ncbi:MAG: type I restriction endonuclease [Alphaproteobacteria bacterium]
MSNEEFNQFKERLIEHAHRVTKFAEHCTSEEATKQALILPFIQFLGYDPLNPAEVRPEHEASFSDRNKHKVDYAIFQDDLPVIAIECKQVGTQLRDHRGQLKGYFNAVPTAKLGILTDGIRIELFADSDEPNIMDDKAFMKLNLQRISEQKHVADEVVEGLFQLSKGMFDPANIGAEAKRKLIGNSILSILQSMHSEPDEEFIRLLLKRTGAFSVINKNVLETYSPLVQDALSQLVDNQLLERLNLRTDRLPPASRPQADHEEDTNEPATPEPTVIDDGIETTETELAIFDYVKRRLSFLVNSAEEFDSIDDIDYRDMKTKFTVYFRMTKKGRLLDFTERSDGTMIFDFPAIEQFGLEVEDLSEIDKHLIDSYRTRLADFA